MDTHAASTQLNGSIPNGVEKHGVIDSGVDRLQIVDEQKSFSTELPAQLQKWGLYDCGFDYNIVAVFGSQSTGKSTLLNRLFGTNFDVMDESRRQQTTKGIWMCRGKGMNVMVMDVEGTDGRERGEDQDFERKSALFSLASSEVLLINLWEHQVGLYQGANMGLLKTVLEVNLSLFGKSANQKTLLLFVIRDFIGTTPLENLSTTLTTDIQRMWDSLSKPAELQDAKFSDYFDLSFVTLPHKILAADKFDLEVKELRKRFVDKTDNGFVFKSSYHKRIPADGVALYMTNIWEQVQANKDLDLPTQQELLAQFRCDEIAGVALAEFNEQAKSQKRPVELGRVVDGLGVMMKQWRSDALARYDRDASRYHKSVYTRKRTDLLSVVDSVLSPLFLGQLKNVHKACLVAFKKEMLDGLRGENSNFADVVSIAREKCEDDFTTIAREARLDDTDWVWEDELDLLREEVSSVADQCRADETKKMVNQIERHFKKQISDPVELQLSIASADMWDKVLLAHRQILENCESSYLSRARTFNCTDEENAMSLAVLRRRAWLALRAKIDEQTADPVILGKLRAYFEERFRYDEGGIPRVWKPEDDIDGAFKKAKDQTLELISLYSRIQPQDPANAYELPVDAPLALADDHAEEDIDFESSLIIFSETKALDLSTRFRKDADAYYVEAKRSTVSSVAQIPAWMYGVLVVLGWNEAMAVLFNPLYFTVLLCALATGWIILKLGLLGPLLQVSRTVGNEIQRQATDRLRQHFSQPALTNPIELRPVRATTADDDDDGLREDVRQRRA